MSGNMPFTPYGNVQSVFDLDAEQRNEYLRSMGATNVNPPLPRSKYLKVKKTGRVLPWDDMLAEQQDLVENCDMYGNTDPNMWAPDVLPPDAPEEDKALLLAMAQTAIMKSASELADGYRQPDEEDAKPQPLAYDHQAVPYEEIEVLTNKLKNLADQL